MSDFDAANVEYERERNEPRPEAVPTAAKSKLGCLSVIGYFIGGLVLFRLIVEIAGLLFR